MLFAAISDTVIPLTFKVTAPLKPPPVKPVPAVTEGVENGDQENGVAGGDPSSDADHSKAGVRESLGPEAEDLIIQLFEWSSHNTQ